MTFLPCFFFIFLLAPYIELLANNPRIQAALVGVTAAVVGVIANLAVFFATTCCPRDFSVAGSTSSRCRRGGSRSRRWQRFKVPIYVMVPVGGPGGVCVDAAGVGEAVRGEDALLILIYQLPPSLPATGSPSGAS